jgi:hypothetical protein
MTALPKYNFVVLCCLEVIVFMLFGPVDFHFKHPHREHNHIQRVGVRQSLRLGQLKITYHLSELPTILYLVQVRPSKRIISLVL